MGELLDMAADLDFSEEEVHDGTLRIDEKIGQGRRKKHTWQIIQKSLPTWTKKFSSLWHWVAAPAEVEEEGQTSLLDHLNH